MSEALPSDNPVQNSSLMGQPVNETQPALRHRITDPPEQSWEKWWLWVSERLNPIVVKEVRQSLKSRQFTISFGLTLVAAVSWTLIAISLMVPRIFYMPAGVPLLSGYFCILVVPLMVIIPFSAYLSLTAETEDSTFELLSISALSALQIVHGKMASACVQILLYLSALAPCIVLTYLLRGVGLYTILFFLGWTVVLSICETALALLLGALARTRMLQVGAAVLALAGLFFGVGTWLTFLFSALNYFSNPSEGEYVVVFAVVTVLAMSVALVLRAAAAAIDFPSENHSTPLRRRLLALLTVICFWSFFGIIVAEEMVPATILLFGLFFVLMALGALVTGERGVISPRAQRSLPRTFLGRVFLTWFYPGAGLGYVFIVGLFAAVVGSVSLLDLYYDGKFHRQIGTQTTIALGYLLLCYLTFFVGFNRLVMLLVSRHMPARMIGSVAIMIVTLLLAHILPLFLVYYANDYREFDYAWHQAFNIVWTVNELSDNVSLDIGASMAIVTLCAIAVFGLNLILCTRDVMMVRVIVPSRVQADESLSQPPPPLPADPFAD